MQYAAEPELNFGPFKGLLFFLFCLVFGASAEARADDVAPEKPYTQWYTGSLISPSGAEAKAGIFGWEPYYSYNQPVGYFGANGMSHPLHPRQETVSNSSLYKYGITDDFSIQAHTAVNYGWKQNNTTSGLKFGDFPVDLIWRFVNADPVHYIPMFNLFAGVSFPTGDYSHLGRSEDGVGNGSYVFRLALTEQSTYTLPGNHALRLRMWGTFRRALTAARISDVSSYGTTKGFQGYARPGMNGQTGFSLEYGVNQRWVLAMDLARDWSNGARIWGQQNGTSNVDRIRAASSDWLIAPAVEYNWSPRFGIIAGVSTYFAGHNTGINVAPQFAFNSLF